MPQHSSYSSLNASHQLAAWEMTTFFLVFSVVSSGSRHIAEHDLFFFLSPAAQNIIGHGQTFFLEAVFVLL